MPGARQQGHLVAHSLFQLQRPWVFFPWSSPGAHPGGVGSDALCVSPLSEITRLNTTLWLLRHRAPGAAGFASPPGLNFSVKGMSKKILLNSASSLRIVQFFKNWQAQENVTQAPPSPVSFFHFPSRGDTRQGGA